MRHRSHLAPSRGPRQAMLLFGFTLLAAVATASAQEGELQRTASWQVLDADEAQAKLEPNWSDEEASVRKQVETIWSASEPADLLERVASTAVVLHPDTKSLVEHCRQAESAPRAIEFDWSLLPMPLQANLRLFYARWLVQQNLYDEADSELAQIELTDVVDPAALLFYRTVTSHRLLKKEACAESANLLLENAGQIPRRYEQLAQLMAADISPLKVDSPDEIARLMDDVGRRLDLGRAGKRVRKKEDEIVAKLDKIIEQIEQQMQQQQQQQQSPQGGQGGRPLDDSRAAGGGGPGDVDPKELANRGNWGNLPPEKRRSALQQISRELGAHYREIIEEYFRKIARESD